MALGLWGSTALGLIETGKNPASLEPESYYIIIIYLIIIYI